MPDRSESEGGAGMMGRDIRVVWRWKWFIAAIAVAAAIAAYYYSAREPAQYKATTQLAYLQPVNPSNPLLGQYYDPAIGQLALESVANVVASPDVRKRAEAILVAPATADYSVSAELQAGGGTLGYSSAVAVTAVSTNAAEAAAVANAYAQAVMEWSKDQQLARIADAEAATRSKLRDFTSPAARSSSDYLALQQQLRNLEILAAVVTPQFQVVTPAVVPSEPFAPRPLRSAAFGFAGAVLAGIALALAFEAFSPRLRGRHDVARALDMPVLGVIPRVSSKTLARDSVLTLTQPDGSTAEAFRLVRSNIEYLGRDDSRTLLVTSCVAGEGKSLTACNLAVALTMAGKKAVLIDGDLRKPRVHDYFGLPNEVGLSDVLNGTARLVEVLQRVDLPQPRRSQESGGDSQHAAAPARRLLVVTSGPRAMEPGELAASSRLDDAMRELRSSALHYAIVDSPALMEVGDAAAIAALVDELLMVVDISKVTRSMLADARELLEPLPCGKLGVVLFAGRQGRNGYYVNRD